MDSFLLALRSAAEPTRLRLLALAGRGAFCVTEFCEILEQSQPRLSRHLRLLCESGLLERVREGANVWFTVPAGQTGGLARELIARLPETDQVLERDRRHASRVLAERARVASDSFRRAGAEWDELRALDLPAEAIETALSAMIPTECGRLLDIGTGTGRALELLGGRVREAIGIDASKAMLALARARLARAGLNNCSVRLADMYRLPLADGGFDVAVLQMVLHYAEQPGAVLAEAVRVVRPGGALVVIDLGEHEQTDVAGRLAHRWPGFAEPAMTALLREAGAAPAPPRTICGGALPVRLWSAVRNDF